jgi:hypothetical protein
MKWRQAARNRPRTVPEPGRCRPFRERHLGTDGLFTGPPLRQPGSLELTGPIMSPSQIFETHGFASPSCDGFALSRMKGVWSRRDATACPAEPPQKLATRFA